VIYEPEEIATTINVTPHDIRVIPWEHESVSVNYFDELSCARAVNEINDRVMDVEACDPFVSRACGVDGVGEGLVYYPIGVATRIALSNLMFKAKGTKHQGVKDYKPAQIDVAVIAAANEFAERFVTEARCEQGLVEACSGDADMRQIGQFMGWICKDVAKESGAELEANGLEWKAVAKSVQNAAKKWFVERCQMAA
jgi:hypothetical protein